MSTSSGFNANSNNNNNANNNTDTTVYDIFGRAYTLSLSFEY